MLWTSSTLQEQICVNSFRKFQVSLLHVLLPLLSHLLNGLFLEVVCTQRLFQLVQLHVEDRAV